MGVRLLSMLCFFKTGNITGRFELSPCQTSAGTLFGRTRLDSHGASCLLESTHPMFWAGNT